MLRGRSLDRAETGRGKSAGPFRAAAIIHDFGTGSEAPAPEEWSRRRSAGDGGGCADGLGHHIQICRTAAGAGAGAAGALGVVTLSAVVVVVDRRALGPRPLSRSRGRSCPRLAVRGRSSSGQGRGRQETERAHSARGTVFRVPLPALLQLLLLHVVVVLATAAAAVPVGAEPAAAAAALLLLLPTSPTLLSEFRSFLACFQWAAGTLR